MARQIEAELDPNKPSEPKPAETTLREAVEVFLADQTARGLVKESKKKYRTLLERQLLAWADKSKIKFLKRIKPADLTKFRGTWGSGETTMHRKHEMLMSFFKFCQRNELIRKNPMEAIKKPKTPDVVPTDYFLREGFANIVAATYGYRYGVGNDCRFRGLRLRALTLLMRWAGLSILDATKLERHRLSKNDEGDDQIFLYRAKTGVPVHVILLPDVAEFSQYV